MGGVFKSSWKGRLMKNLCMDFQVSLGHYTRVVFRLRFPSASLNSLRVSAVRRGVRWLLCTPKRHTIRPRLKHLKARNDQQGEKSGGEGRRPRLRQPWLWVLLLPLCCPPGASSSDSEPPGCVFVHLHVGSVDSGPGCRLCSGLRHNSVKGGNTSAGRAQVSLGANSIQP